MWLYMVTNCTLPPPSLEPSELHKEGHLEVRDQARSQRPKGARVDIRGCEEHL